MVLSTVQVCTTSQFLQLGASNSGENTKNIDSSNRVYIFFVPYRKIYSFNFLAIAANISSVIEEMFHSGFQPHSSRAQVSSS